MADLGDKASPTGAVRNFVELIDHPLIFGLAIVFMVVPIMALITAGAKWAGLPGLASLMQTP